LKSTETGDISRNHDLGFNRLFVVEQIFWFLHNVTGDTSVAKNLHNHFAVKLRKHLFQNKSKFFVIGHSIDV